MELLEVILELKKANYNNFSIFYEQTKKQVYFSAISILKDHQAALDIVQDTYISFLNNIASFDEKRNVHAYLSTIARNLSINQYNREKRVINDADFIANQKDLEVDPYMDSKIKAILDLLDDDLEREIIVYHAIWDYKFKDIANILNKPLGTVLWIYNKAIKKLKERMKGYEN